MSEKSNSVLKTLKSENRFFIAHVMDDIVTEQAMDVLPPHITLLPPFNARGADAAIAFLDTVKDIESLDIRIGAKLKGVELFGDHNDIAVRTIDDESSMALRVVHGLFLARLRPFIRDVEYSGQNYNPHMTIQSSEQDPGEGTSVCIDSACLIQRKIGGYMIYAAERFGDEK